MTPWKWNPPGEDVELADIGALLCPGRHWECPFVYQQAKWPLDVPPASLGVELAHHVPSKQQTKLLAVSSLKDPNARAQAGRQDPSNDAGAREPAVEGMQQTGHLAIDVAAAARQVCGQQPAPTAGDLTTLLAPLRRHYLAEHVRWLQEPGIILGVIVTPATHPARRNLDHAMDDGRFRLGREADYDIAYAGCTLTVGRDLQQIGRVQGGVHAGADVCTQELCPACERGAVMKYRQFTAEDQPFV